MPELVDALAGWVKMGLILAGVLGTNVLSNGVQYNQISAPAVEAATERDDYGEAMEGRYYACLDRYADVSIILAKSHEARLFVCQQRLASIETELRDCRAGR